VSTRQVLWVEAWDSPEPPSDTFPLVRECLAYRVGLGLNIGVADTVGASDIFDDTFDDTFG